MVRAPTGQVAMILGIHDHMSTLCRTAALAGRDRGDDEMCHAFFRLQPDTLLLSHDLDASFGFAGLGLTAGR